MLFYVVITSRTIYDFSLENKEVMTLHVFACRCLQLAHDPDSDFKMEAKEMALLGKLMFGIEEAKNINT